MILPSAACATFAYLRTPPVKCSERRHCNVSTYCDIDHCHQCAGDCVLPSCRRQVAANHFSKSMFRREQIDAAARIGCRRRRRRLCTCDKIARTAHCITLFAVHASFSKSAAVEHCCVGNIALLRRKQTCRRRCRLQKSCHETLNATTPCRACLRTLRRRTCACLRRCRGKMFKIVASKQQNVEHNHQSPLAVP